MSDNKGENNIETTEIEQRENSRKKTSKTKTKKSTKKKSSKKSDKKETKKKTIKEQAEIKEEEKIEENKEEEEKKEEEIEIPIEEEKKEEEIIPEKTFAEGEGGPQFSEEVYLRKCIRNKDNNINDMSKDQEQFKNDLHVLLLKLNDTLTKNAEILYKRPQDEDFNLIEKLNYIASLRRKDIQTAKNQNKIYKEQYELLNNKFKNTNTDKIDEIENKIEEMKLENHKLTKDIRDFRGQRNKKAKELEVYSANKVYPKEIKGYTEEVKTLSSKKHEYYMKLNKNKKSLLNEIAELERAKNLYQELHDTQNYFNAKIEEDINRLKEDLNGTEDEIFEKAENETAFILRQNKKNIENKELFKTPKILKPIDHKNIKVGKSSNFLNNENKINYDKYNYNPQTIRKKYAIAVRNKSKSKDINKNDNNIIDDENETHATYDNTTDYEYKNILNKKRKIF